MSDAQVILSVPYSAADGYTILWNLPSGRASGTKVLLRL